MSGWFRQLILWLDRQFLGVDQRLATILAVEQQNQTLLKQVLAELQSPSAPVKFAVTFIKEK